jgi:hypothetical protein
MFIPPYANLELTDDHKSTLSNIVIDDSSPGSILHDFDALLEHIRKDGIQLTATHRLSLNSLEELNQLLASPIDVRLKRPQQKSYPPLFGLLLLLRASGLTLVDETGKKPRLILDEALYQKWTDLNPTEKYGTLLEAWLLRGKQEIIGEHGRIGALPDNFRLILDFFYRNDDDYLEVAGGSSEMQELKYAPMLHNLGLLPLFGFITIEDSTPQPGDGWYIESITSMPLGYALLAVLYTDFFKKRDFLEYPDQELIPFGLFQPVLKPYWPQWENTFEEDSSSSEFRLGTYIFKVSLGRMWRRISIDGDKPLDDLASAILNSVEFDHDHLYEFSYSDRYGVTQRIVHSYMREYPVTSEVKVGDIPLSEGQTMTFLFDFGDSWKFDVTLEEIKADTTGTETRVIESRGEPPEQYPSW